MRDMNAIKFNVENTTYRMVQKSLGTTGNMLNIECEIPAAPHRIPCKTTLAVCVNRHYEPQLGRHSEVGVSGALGAGRSGGRIPVGATFPTPVQTGPGTHPASPKMGTGFLPGSKASGVQF
jgi:hypothetical protein